MADELTTLTDSVTNIETVDGSVLALVKGLAAQIAANATNPVALKALSDRLNAQATALAAAVTGNTPPAP